MQANVSFPHPRLEPRDLSGSRQRSGLLHILVMPIRLAAVKIQVAIIYRLDPGFSHWQSRGLEYSLAPNQWSLPDRLKRDQLSIRRCRSDRRSESHGVAVIGRIR